MFEVNRNALETAQQLRVVIRALGKAKKVLMADHIENQLEEAVGALSPELREKLGKLTKLAKYI